MADEAQDHMQRFLDALGFVGDPEMAATAERFTQLLTEFSERPAPEVSLCAAEMPGQVVCIRRIPFHSLCAHHLLPFFGHVDVAYKAGDKLVGFGSIPRVVKWAARQPQLQERLAASIADVLIEELQPQGVLIRIEARQMCVEMRGAESPASVVVERRVGDTEGLDRLLG